jgi:propanol-preferring alcohol dehydrogenase
LRAVRLHAAHEELRIEELPIPEPAGSEVRIRIAGCGVCHTDLHVVDGIQTRVELPVTLGHEVAGWVDAMGPDGETDLRIGDAVVVHGGWGCGACGECGAGDEQRCERSGAPGYQADGGYAEAMLVPHPRHLVPLHDLDPVRAAPLGDAGITPFRAVRRAEPWLVAGARVLLIGCGGLGQFALQYLRLVPKDGAELIVGVSELSPARMAKASELGADVTLMAGEPAGSIEALGGRADVVFDFVGTDATLAHAAAVVGPGGLVVLVGEAGGSLVFGFDHVPIESWLTTVAWGSVDDLHRVVALAEAGRLRWDVEALPLVQAATAHLRLRTGDVSGRLVLVP